MDSLSYRARFRSDHRWTTVHLSDYLDRDLDRQGRLRVERHIAECRDCRRALRGLREVLEALHRLPTPAGGNDPRETSASVLRRLHDGR